MTKESFKRKLTAILSADVVGYSRLMGNDEEATLRTLTEYRGVMTMLIQQHSGRVLDSKGDNLLAEFSSVVEAVLCAVAIQKEIKARNDKLPEDRRMDFRIGVNLGDVIDNGESIYGDGVNIAARLESLAKPGGICISKTTFDHVDSKLPYGYEYMGDQIVKNIARPVPAYRVLMEPESAGRLFGERRSKLKGWGLPVITMIALVAVGVVIWDFILRSAVDPGNKQNRVAAKGTEGSGLSASKGVEKKEEPEENYEIIFWQSIEESNNSDMFQEYLRRFPDGAFSGLAKIRIKTLNETNSTKLAALSKHKKLKAEAVPVTTQNNKKLGVDSIKTTSIKEENLEGKNKKKKTALHLPQEKGDEAVVKTAQPAEKLKSNNTIEIAVFPWRFILRAFGVHPIWTKTQSVDGLRQVLSEFKLVVPKYSYYDLGNQFNAKNIKGNLLTEAIVEDFWIKKSAFSKSKVNLDLICRLGRQLQVDAVLIYSIDIDHFKQNADIILIDIKNRQAYSKTGEIKAKMLSSDIKDLTETFFYRLCQ